MGFDVRGVRTTTIYTSFSDENRLYMDLRPRTQNARGRTAHAATHGHTYPNQLVEHPQNAPHNVIATSLSLTLRLSHRSLWHARDQMQYIRQFGPSTQSRPSSTLRLRLRRPPVHHHTTHTQFTHLFRTDVHPLRGWGMGGGGGSSKYEVTTTSTPLQAEGEYRRRPPAARGQSSRSATGRHQ